MAFVNLHVHSEYSLLDGACRLSDMVTHAKAMGQTALAVTDHGNMFAAVDFYSECISQGIKPIIGCEVYVAPRSRFDKVFGVDSHPYHLILLCKNNTGYQNLIKLVSLGYTEGFYSKPRIDLDLLREHSSGLICLSGCIAGEIPRLIQSGDFEGAKQTALMYEGIFGKGNYYLEVQNHGLPEDARVLPSLYRLSNETGIPLAATNDAHYVKKSDSSIQRILLAIQTNTSVNENIPIAFPNDEFYLKSESEMLSLFRGRADAVENTAKIADMCEFEMELGVIKLPRYELSEAQKRKYGQTNEDFFRNMCRHGLIKRYGENPAPHLTERLEYELDVVVKMGYTDYYLIVWDFINYAGTQDIPVGPGRGSGAGSIAAYCIGITDIDPIKYNLLFERFLNPERVSMPDFDIDFCYERRQEVIDYVVRKYGSDKVAQIVSFVTMAAKAAVRDTARVMELPYSVGDTVSRLIPQSLHITLKKALEESAELKQLYDTDINVHRLIDNACAIEGMPRNMSVHAAGVVICDAPVMSYVPLVTRDDAVSTQYTMTALEKVGLLKMDFLGLKNLTIIHDCEKAVRKHIPDFSVDKVPDDDTETFEMLSQGRTTGVFQFESAGMRQLLIKLRPRSIEDLTAALSLYRPGPMDSIPRYLDNRSHPDNIRYAHPILKDILSVTYGCIVYQEQVMEICRKMAGYSYGRADLVRRAMAKKKHSVMEQERSVFVEGAIRNGVTREIADGIFDEMAGFASYAFNKSHAAAYSVVAYRTAYLKRHYPKEYFAAVMSAYYEHTGKLMEIISECDRFGIKILRPDINESGAGFTAVEDGIRFSVTAAKNVGRSVAAAITEEREKNGDFRSLSDLVRRMNGRDLNRRCAESLIKCGALDCFGLNRRQMLENYDIIASAAADFSRGAIEGQLDFFGISEGTDSPADAEENIPYTEEYPYEELLEMEKDILGIYISGHPLKKLRTLARSCGLPDIAAMSRLNAEEKCSFVCRISGIKPHSTKSGSMMAFAQAEDMSGNTEMLVFPAVYTQAKAMLTVGAKLYIEGRVSSDRDGNPNFIADRIIPADAFTQNICSTAKLYIRCQSTQKDIIEKCALSLKHFPGNNPVIFRLSDIDRSISHKEAKTCRICYELIEKLNSAAGCDNVALVYKKL